MPPIPPRAPETRLSESGNGGIGSCGQFTAARNRADDQCYSKTPSRRSSVPLRAEQSARVTHRAWAEQRNLREVVTQFEIGQQAKFSRSVSREFGRETGRQPM